MGRECRTGLPQHTPTRRLRLARLARLRLGQWSLYGASRWAAIQSGSSSDRPALIGLSRWAGGDPREQAAARGNTGLGSRERAGADAPRDKGQIGHIGDMARDQIT